MYTTDNSGLLISMVSIPYSGGNLDFFEREFKNGLFKKYKDSINFYSNGPNAKIVEPYYKPKSYYIYGDYDLAILSLIDDFSLGSRKFHPSHSYVNTSDSFVGANNFNYQVITGFLSNDNIFNNTLIDLSSKTFLLEKNPYPFLSITKLKINNGFLIGNGQKLLSIIHEFIDSVIHPDLDIDFILLDTVCNNELALLIFSRNYKLITNSLLAIREINLGSVEYLLTNINSSIANGKKEIFDDLKANCLYNKLMTSHKIASCSLDKLHLFSNTHTILGYDHELMRSSKAEIVQKITKDLQFEYEWDIKPGHIKNIIKYLYNQDQKSDFLVNIGHGVLSTYQDLNTKAILPDIFKLLFEEKPSLLPHLRKFKSYPRFVLDNNLLDKMQDIMEEEHTSLSNYLLKLTFTNEDISNINDALRKLNISKILRERVLKMFSNFNNCIQDNDLYMYFIEIKEFLKCFLDTIIQWADNKELASANRHKWIGYVLESFEKAYQNRFHQSNRTMDIADFNLEYNGGVQQLISSLDACYKAIIKPLSYDEMRSFVIVSSYEGVISKRDIVRLNYFHLFQPELFISIITKEAANFQINRRNFDFKILTDLRIKKILEEYFDSFSEEKFSSDIRDELKNKLAETEFSDIHLKNELINNIDCNFLHYIYTDMITFLMGYSGDKDLFYFWYWSTTLQMSQLYNRNGEFKRNYFLGFLSRFLVVLSIFHDPFIKTIALKPPSYILNNLWNSYFADVNLFCKKLFEVKKFHEWIGHTRHSIDQLLKNSFEDEVIFDFFNTVPLRELSKQEYVQKISMLPKFKEKFKNFEDPENFEYNKKYEEKFIGITALYFTNESNYFINKLREGEVIEYSSCLIESTSSYVIKLFRAYLMVLKELCNNKIIVLPRDSYGKPDVYFLQNIPDSNMFIDTHGGLFISCHNTRKKYFKIRTAFLKSIWDFCLKSKIDLFP